MKIYILIFLLIILLINNTKFVNENFEGKSFIKPSNWRELGFNDKLIIYGKQLGKEHSVYADKYLLKEKIGKMTIPNLNFPKTLKILPPNIDLNLDELPNNCVVKSNCGQGDIIIIKNREIIKMISRGKKMKTYSQWYKNATKPLNYRPQIEPHYKYIKPLVFVEEYMGDEINDYKFFVINGKFAFCQIDSGRFTNWKSNFYDKNFNLLKFSKGNPINYDNINRPKNYLELISISENIAKYIGFDFIRVDLYNINQKIYLGEITFVPSAGEKKYMIRPQKYDIQIGKLWV
jgi:hypothetical protein